MKDLLKKLVEMDKEAQAIDEELRKEKDNLDAEIQKEVQATKDKCMAEAQAELDKEVEKLRQDAEAQWSLNYEKYDISRKNLENHFNDNFDNWVDEIVAEVLN